jgi:hypothetical protein
MTGLQPPRHAECMASACPPPTLAECAWPRCAPVPQWPCEAYGPEGFEFGAICFMSAVPGTRLCKDAGMCGLQMAHQRREAHARMSRLAAEGDPVMQYLAGEFPTPDTLLNGLRETRKDGGEPES